MKKGIEKESLEGLRRIKYVIIYGILYMTAFGIIENSTAKPYMIHTNLDEMIPFCKYFVVPYLLWFIYIGVTIMYFAFFNESREEYYRLIWTLGIGMTIFIVVSFIFPNGQKLRPYLIEDDIFTKLVQLVYRKDTPTNIFPSIHVYNSIACCVAILKNERCRSRKWVTTGTVILTILIIVSTVMIKQHSVVDLVGALVLNMVVYGVVYGKKFVYWFKRRGAVS